MTHALKGALLRPDECDECRKTFVSLTRSCQDFNVHQIAETFVLSTLAEHAWLLLADSPCTPLKVVEA